jgi:hypothetical protein
MAEITGPVTASIGDREFCSAPAHKGSGAMPDCRVYIIEADGHFHNSVHLDCADDLEAKKQSEQLVDGHDVELWQRDRKIARFNDTPKIQS